MFIISTVKINKNVKVIEAEVGYHAQIGRKGELNIKHTLNSFLDTVEHTYIQYMH